MSLTFNPNLSAKHSTAVMRTVSFKGIQAILIDVEVYIGNEMPAFIICGLGDKAIAESKERVKSSLKCIGATLPAKRIVINLSPANIPKEGSHFDLPIALAILKALGYISNETLDNYIAIGELSLSGDLTSVNNALITAIEAQGHGLGVICPSEVGPEAALVDRVPVIASKNLLEIVNILNGKVSMQNINPFIHKPESRENANCDFGAIKGSENIKRALTIAIYGGHNVLLIGSPGAGKSTICNALKSIQTPMSLSESLEVSKIYSAAGMLRNGLITERPFRNPHHTASRASMIGGGKTSKPGEISLAHRGILFLDELALWEPAILNALRESMETGNITVSRVESTVTYPAKFQLIAATNPCPCGKAYEQNVSCSKLPLCVKNYINRIPGPILDRIDMIIKVDPIQPWDIDNANNSESSANICMKILNAKKNLEMLSDTKKQYSASAISFLNRFAAAKQLSMRNYNHAKDIAQSIADLDGSEQIGDVQIKEALSYLGLGLV